MAKHYNSFQFDMPYRPTYLRNWEVPKYYCPRPGRRTGITGIISNPRGHLLPGVPRPLSSPFGDFIGTWEMPKKITRQVANKMNGTTDKEAFMEKCRQITLGATRRKTASKKEHSLERTEMNALKTNEVQGIKEEAERIICPIHDF